MSVIVGSGPYSPSSNSTIMNKNKQVNHSKQETISVIFTHSSPNPSAPQYIVLFDLTGNSKTIVVVIKTLLITSSTFLNSGS